MRVLIVFSYDGSRYHGWQTQHKHNSIQEEFEKVLKEMHHHKVEIVSSGRTDSHVHALNQCAHFDTDLNIKMDGIVMALNSSLPKDIRVKKAIRVSDDFHARFSSISKRYDYYLSNDDKNPFIVNYMGVEKKPLDIKTMKKVCEVFIGKHDFTSFTSAKVNPLKDRIRKVTRCELNEDNKVIHFIFEGDGFMRYQIRMMVQTIIEVGKGRINTADVRKMLEAKSKHSCKYKASANGLYLVKVTYEGINDED